MTMNGTGTRQLLLNASVPANGLTDEHSGLGDRGGGRELAMDTENLKIDMGAQNYIVL